LKNSKKESGTKRWIIRKIAKTAGRNIENLDYEHQEKVLLRLEELQVNPFQGDVKKIQGKFNTYRLRMGEYRLYFRLVPESGSIEILLFESQGGLKKKTIQRLP
jgi:mRNA-degrading endonuclease RelE of RelBE toxin-antitoxin system